MDEIEHRGKSAFNPDAGYQVFRNVRDFGAKGDSNPEHFVMLLIMVQGTEWPMIRLPSMQPFKLVIDVLQVSVARLQLLLLLSVDVMLKGWGDTDRVT